MAVAAAGSARTTNALPSGKVPSLCATRCRSRRVTRCRTTELPTALLTTKPALRGCPGSTSACSTKRRRPVRTPPRITARNSSLRRRRASAGNTPRPVVAGCDVIRRRAGCGPCDGGPPGWRGLHASASAAGTHGSARDDGCSAGRCACSRQSFSWSCGDRSSVPPRRATRSAPGTVRRAGEGAAVSGRPYEGTQWPPVQRHHPPGRRRRRVPAPPSGRRVTRLYNCAGGVPKPVVSLPSRAACGYAHSLLACPSSVVTTSTGAVMSAPGVQDSFGAGAWSRGVEGPRVGRTLVHKLWTTLWIPAARVATPTCRDAPPSRRGGKGRGEGSGAACLSIS